MAPLMDKNWVDVIKALGTTSATSDFLKDEIFRCLANTGVVNTVQENDLPDIHWTKNLPTSKIFSSLSSVASSSFKCRSAL